jgi:PST family polysaccharide transporter
MILPLITYPYLIRVLGKETYGLVIFAQAITVYFLMLVSFGFNVSATKEVSINRHNKKKLSEIVNSVFIIKTCLFLFSIFILAVLSLFIPKIQAYSTLFYLSLWLCLYDILFPVWYFQGIEQMKYITYITLLSRLIFLGLIFVFIHAPEDYLFVPIINGIGAISAGCVSMIIVYHKHRMKFEIPSYKTLLYYFKDSIPIFISSVTSKLYVSTNKVLIGIFLTMSEVAYYDLAEKVLNVLKVPQQIIGQTVFPRISMNKDVNFVKKVLYISFILNVLFFVTVLLHGSTIINFLGGSELLPAKHTMYILAAILPIFALGNILGVQLLIPFGFNRDFTRVIVLSGMFYILQVLFLYCFNLFTIVNISIVIVLSEGLVSLGMFYYCKKNKLLKSTR